jgi:hypothetical protein
VEKLHIRWDHLDDEEETEDKKKVALRPEPSAKPEESGETEPLGK